MNLIRTALAQILILFVLTTVPVLGQSKKTRRSKSRRASQTSQLPTSKPLNIDFSDVASQQEPSEWKFFGSASGQIFFYNTKTISQTQNGFVKIWMKSKYLDESAGRVETLKQRSNNRLPIDGYENFAFSLMAYEVNCSSQKFRLISFIDYDSSGKVLDSDDFEGKWSDPVPDSIGEGILHVACSN